jgi:hypothetical protein
MAFTITHRIGTRTGCRVCACPNCSPNNRNRNWDANGNCAECGKPSLEWVATGPQKLINGKMRWTGLKFVPFGTDDFSGVIHPTGYCDGDSASAPAASAPASAVPASAPASAVPASFDDSAIQARLDAITARLDSLASASGSTAEIDALRTEYADLATAIGEIGVRIDGKLTAVDKRLDDAFKARPVTINAPGLPAFTPKRRMHHMAVNVAAMVLAVGDAGVVVGVGGAGDGKSSMGRDVYDILALKHYEEIGGHQEMTADDVVGLNNPIAHQYDASPARRVFETAKSLCVIDEFPRFTTAASSAFNGMLAARWGQSTGFPDGSITRANESYFLGFGNNLGQGADSQYSDGGGFDTATLTRCAFIPIDTDKGLAAAITGLPFTPNPQPYPDPVAPRDISDPICIRFAAHVEQAHDLLRRDGDTALISIMRTGQMGARMLTAGIDVGLVYWSLFWSHMSEDTALKVQTALGINERGENI